MRSPRHRRRDGGQASPARRSGDAAYEIDSVPAAFPLTFQAAWHMLITPAQRRSDASEQFGKIVFEI